MCPKSRIYAAWHENETLRIMKLQMLHFGCCGDTVGHIQCHGQAAGRVYAKDCLLLQELLCMSSTAGGRVFLTKGLSLLSIEQVRSSATLQVVSQVPQRTGLPGREERFTHGSGGIPYNLGYIL